MSNTMTIKGRAGSDGELQTGREAHQTTKESNKTAGENGP